MATFSLLKLPLLPLKLVIGLMKIEDQVKLSMTSNKTEEFIKLIKYLVYNFDIHLKNGNPYFDIFRFKQDTCNVRFNRVNNGEVFDRKHWINWYKDQSDRVIDLKSMNPIDDVMNVMKRLRPLFKIDFLEWKLYLDELTTKEIKELLPIIISEKCDMVTVLNGNISSGLLTYILDTMKPELRLKVNSDIPSDFKHKKAFSFYCSDYKNGLWVTIEDLFTIRDRYFIKLETTNFDFNDINRFLHYWINCDQDMMKTMSLQLKKGSVFDRKVIFRKMSTYENYYNGIYTHFILSKKKEGKRIIGSINYDDEKLIFSTWLPTDDCSYVIPILKMSHRLNELKETYTEITNEENKYQDEWAQTTIGSIERANFEEELTRIRVQKEEIKTEFDGIIGKLTEQGITGSLAPLLLANSEFFF